MIPEKICNINCPNTTPPTKEGKYFWMPSSNILSPEIITVIEYPSVNHGGIEFMSYMGVVEFCGRNVDCLKGHFSDILTFTSNKN